MIEIRTDTRALESVISTLRSIPGAYEKAARNAMSRVVQSVSQEAVRQTRDRYWITAGRVRKAFRVAHTSSGGYIKVSGRLPNLKNYKLSPSRPQKRRKLLRAAVKRDSGLKTIPHSFLLPGGGNYLAFQRVGRDRKDIRSLTGPAIPQMVKNEEIVAAMTEKAQKTFEKRMRHEMMRAIGAIR